MKCMKHYIVRVSQAGICESSAGDLKLMKANNELKVVYIILITLVYALWPLNVL